MLSAVYPAAESPGVRQQLHPPAPQVEAYWKIGWEGDVLVAFLPAGPGLLMVPRTLLPAPGSPEVARVGTTRPGGPGGSVPVAFS